MLARLEFELILLGSEIDPDLDLDSDDSNPDQIDMDVNDSIGTIEEEPDTIQAQGPVSPARGVRVKVC